MLVSAYEAFYMKNNESISEMYARLTLITNGLKSLGKTYFEVVIPWFFGLRKFGISFQASSVIQRFRHD